MRATVNAIGRALKLDVNTELAPDTKPDVAALEAEFPRLRSSCERCADRRRSGSTSTPHSIVTEGSSEDDIVQGMATKLGFRNVYFSPREAAGLGDAAGNWDRTGTSEHAVCFVGDGGSLFSIHAIWTAAAHQIPWSTSASSMRVPPPQGTVGQLRGWVTDTTKFVGLDFNQPPVDVGHNRQGTRGQDTAHRRTGGSGRRDGRGARLSGPTFVTIKRER